MATRQKIRASFVASGRVIHLDQLELREVGPEDVSSLEYEDYDASGAAQGVAFVIVRNEEVSL